MYSYCCHSDIYLISVTTTYPYPSHYHIPLPSLWLLIPNPYLSSHKPLSLTTTNPYLSSPQTLTSYYYKTLTIPTALNPLSPSLLPSLAFLTAINVLFNTTNSYLCHSSCMLALAHCLLSLITVFVLLTLSKHSFFFLF